MKHGKVKWFDPSKQFGFITSEGQDYFVHTKSLRNGEALTQGQHVTFTPKPGTKGEQAGDVEVIEADGNR